MASEEDPSYRSLLLLPPPPPPQRGGVDSYGYTDLRHRYGPALSTALRFLAPMARPAGARATLDVALPCRDLGQRRPFPRSQVYGDVQRLLAGIYKLICVICAREDIDTGVRGGLDARVLMLSWDDEDDPAPPGTTGPRPALDLETLARSERPWRIVFSVDDESGDQVLGRFREMAQVSTGTTSTWEVRRVDRGEPSGDVVAPLPSVDLDARCKRHARVAVGGTFDHLHAGHKLLLTMSALLVEPDDAHDHHRRRQLTVGISGDELLRHKAFADYIDPWEQRQADVADFMAVITDFGPPGRQRTVITSTAVSGVGPRVIVRRLDASFDLACVEITDPYGPTITDEDISALVVSHETRAGAQAVNQKRQEKGWDALDVFEVDVLTVVDDDADGKGKTDKLSSTDIRRRLSERQRSIN